MVEKGNSPDYKGQNFLLFTRKNLKLNDQRAKNKKKNSRISKLKTFENVKTEKGLNRRI